MLATLQHLNLCLCELVFTYLSEITVSCVSAIPHYCLFIFDQHFDIHELIVFLFIVALYTTVFLLA